MRTSFVTGKTWTGWGNSWGLCPLVFQRETRNSTYAPGRCTIAYLRALSLCVLWVRVDEQPIQSATGALCCTETCRDALDDGDDPFAGRLQFKHFSTGVTVLDTLLPQGIPTNSFVLLAGENGIRHRSLETELVWRMLTRNEPAIIITFVDPPIAIVEHFLTIRWNLLPYLESGDLQIIDCFTSRLREEHQEPENQASWNDFLLQFIDESVSVGHDPENLTSVEGVLHSTLEEMEMAGTGLVVVDSLNEAEMQGHEFATENFIKEVRGDICSRKFVPLFASVTTTKSGQPTEDYNYLFDGVVEMRRNESYIDGVQLNQLSIRKMDGVQYFPHWVTYAIRGPGGFESYDPRTDLPSVYRTPPTLT